MTAPPADRHEQAARARKAALLADALDRVLAPGDDPAALLDGSAEMELVWAAAQRAAGTRPAGPATRTEVVRLLAARRARPPADPFADDVFGGIA